MKVVEENPFILMAANLRTIADNLEASGGASGTRDGAEAALSDYLMGTVMPAKGTDVRVVSAAVYEMGRARDRIFSGYDIFCDPAWNILLAIYTAMLEGRLPSITTATATAGCPQVTGLRWVRLLESKGLIVRESDNGDKRQKLLRLTPTAMHLMEKTIIRIGELSLKITGATSTR